jgi:hypothetical protein
VLQRFFSVRVGLIAQISGTLESWYALGLPVLNYHLDNNANSYFQAWDLLAGRKLFQNHKEPYNAQHHLAEMIGVLGPVPELLIDRERGMRHWRWSPEARNQDDKLCNNVAEFFGGPFFSDEGELKSKSTFRG